MRYYIIPSPSRSRIHPWVVRSVNYCGAHHTVCRYGTYAEAAWKRDTLSGWVGPARERSMRRLKR